MGGRGGSSAGARAGYLPKGGAGGALTSTAQVTIVAKDGMRPESLARVQAERASGQAMRPIEVAVYHDGQAVLADGRHRLAAAKAAGDQSIAAVVRTYGPNGALKSTTRQSLTVGPESYRVDRAAARATVQRLGAANVALRQVALSSVTDAAAYDAGKLARASAAIASGKALPPVRLLKAEGGGYTVSDGNHRIAAARAAGHTHVPAIVDR